MSTVDNEAPRDETVAAAAPESETVVAAPAEVVASDASVDDSDLEKDSDGWFGPILGSEAWGIFALLIAYMTFLNTLTGPLRQIFGVQVTTQKQDAELTGLGYIVGALITLIATGIGLWQVRDTTPRWARGLLGATMWLGLLLVTIGILYRLRADSLGG